MSTQPENKMRNIRIEKITLNIGSGTEAESAEKAVLLLQKISGAKVIKTITTKRIAAWKVRPGLPVGAMVTLRGKKAGEVLKALLHAVTFKIKKSSFTKNGFSFGIKEYIEIPGIKYDPKIGIIGLEVAISLARPGFRVKRRKIMPAKIHHSHDISVEEGWNWAQKTLGVLEREEGD